MSKKKILVLSDHALSTSGVGTQTRHLINGLIKKDCWTFRQLGAAIKHSDYRTVVVNDDFIIKPIDGFGSPELLRILLATEKPDALLIFTDPRFFTWLYEIEDEIHQVCPILWWHVWDNYPTPRFNDHFYEATDAINCHSYLTYSMCSENFADKTNFIPHAIPEDLYFPFEDDRIKTLKNKMLPNDKKDHFIVSWVNRNARRKRPGDLLMSFRIFLEMLEKKTGHRKASLLLHTDPLDKEGQNLYEVAEQQGLTQNIIFSTNRISFEEMNNIYNISDCYINISLAEGFGLGTLEAMQAGTPIIALKTGGMTRQVVDHRDGSENGVALPVEFKALVGSQHVPYIYEDYVKQETVANGLMKLYDMGDEKRRELGQKARNYVLSEFSYQKTVDLWHDSLEDTIQNWKSRYNKIHMETL
jgi:glycosyltransferase involved in cell wall biosynthesis